MELDLPNKAARIGLLSCSHYSSAPAVETAGAYAVHIFVRCGHVIYDVITTVRPQSALVSAQHSPIRACANTARRSAIRDGACVVPGYRYHPLPA